MKEQDAAHSFEKTHPDFPQWIKSRPGLDCMKWPVGDETYLFNRLFWAFDAGRNCVWDQYINQKSELTRLRSELQQLRMALITRDGNLTNKLLFSELQQERELIKECHYYLKANPPDKTNMSYNEWQRLITETGVPKSKAK